jgi:phosphoglycolate phosphatase
LTTGLDSRTPGRQAQGALVVFDLDGTLIDSRRDLADATNAMLAEYGAPPLPEDAVARMVGEGAAVLVSRALAASGLPAGTPGALDRFLQHYGTRLTVHTRPYEGIPELLAALRADGAAVLAVLTNKPGRATSAILEQLGLAGYFRLVLGGDTGAGRKPDPAGLLSIVRDAGTTPPRTLLVGDSPVDLETARRAGTRICLARYGFGFRFPADAFRGDEAFIDHPVQLLDLVQKA